MHTLMNFHLRKHSIKYPIKTAAFHQSACLVIISFLAQLLYQEIELSTIVHAVGKVIFVGVISNLCTSCNMNNWWHCCISGCVQALAFILRIVGLLPLIQLD
jgi:hypothetical protein